MSRAAAAASAGGQPVAGPGEPGGYLERSERPLTSLVFLLPLMVVYEVGVHGLQNLTERPAQPVVAFTLMREFFALFGVHGRHLPALAVVAILLTWHIARNDGWRVHVPTLAGMTVESVLLVFPLLVMGFLVQRYVPQIPLAAAPMPPGEILTLSLGAGIYEELVFRLILCTFLALILRDLFGLPKVAAGLLIIAASGITFSAYHYLGAEAFSWNHFIFRAVAGAYFAGLFMARGFGVTVASHAAYDVLILSFHAYAR